MSSLVWNRVWTKNGALCHGSKINMVATANYAKKSTCPLGSDVEMQEIQRRLDVGEQSKATTSVGGRGKYCWDCCSHRLLFSQRNMVRCKWTNALL